MMIDGKSAKAFSAKILEAEHFPVVDNSLLTDSQQ
jgi:hypothetical protein